MTIAECRMRIAEWKSEIYSAFRIPKSAFGESRSWNILRERSED